ncbi:NepR family anti-sigma factor [Bosea vestrisii]|uniref:NepR family anti-sigma factor n=1 Tax=Bosea vestrisii TaxID=151416 RepID=UPI0024DF9FA0|nr:NepR family anti-sigma factor [Bosea vestrisii]WID94568.1 NepR family anti-sigma factor [Bosea vestrisii]
MNVRFGTVARSASASVRCVEGRDRRNVVAPIERGIMNLMNVDPPEAARAEADEDVVLDPRVQDSIGRSLKAHYDDLVNAPIPDRFLALLAQLEATEQRLSSEGANERG